MKNRVSDALGHINVLQYARCVVTDNPDYTSS
jgi:hypothetical protein